MKIAPLMRAMSRQFDQVLVHTGQHYDDAMSDVFFRELGMPAPGVNIEVVSGSHAQQTAQVMARFEAPLLEYKPDWVIVPGDLKFDRGLRAGCREVRHAKALWKLGASNVERRRLGS
jgi:UDP-N-acetylglucosamine 2-epimerase (non-hydrolysing)